MGKVLIITIVLLKFIIPSLLLKFPFPAAWTNYFLDVIDGDILRALGLSEFFYQSIDKLADYYSYVFMLILGWRWKIRKTIVVLFLYRTIGQVLFFVTRNELSFFYFQNFLEPLVMIYTLLIFKAGTTLAAHKKYKQHFKLIWGIILTYKIWNEWNLHFANIDLSKLFFGFSGGN